MTDQELEQRLRTAFHHAAPNQLNAILSRCTPNPESTSPLPKASKPHRNPSLRRWLSLAACVALLVGAGGVVYYSAVHQVASIVSLDVNPSVELKVSSRQKVLSAIPMTEDAYTILDGMDLTGAYVDVAVHAIVGSLLRHGYVDQLANSILITVEDQNTRRGQQLQQQLTTQTDAILSSAQVNGSILSQTIQPTSSSSLHQRAEFYGISIGKARLIQTIVERNPAQYTFESLVGLSIHDLNLIYSSALDSAVHPAPPAQSQPIQSSGQVSDAGYIGFEAARTIALNHAGVTSQSVLFQSIEFDYEDGRMVYELEFVVQGLEYEYDIDAITGAIVEHQREYRPEEDTALFQQYIGEDSAKEAALRHAGLSLSDTSYCVSQLEYEDGVPEYYEVEFATDTAQYEYAIHLLDGSVLKVEQHLPLAMIPPSPPQSNRRDDLEDWDDVDHDDDDDDDDD